MKRWIDLQDNYLNDVANCPGVTVANALRMAAQEFCARSKVWKVLMDPALTVAGVSLYEFDITPEQEVAKVVSAKLDGQDLPTLLFEDLGGPQRGLIALNEREFTLQPAPAAGQSLVIAAVLQPSNTATGIDDFIYAAHARAIAGGAKAILLGMKDQPFSDAAGADRARFEFDAAIGGAAARAAKAYSGAPLRTRPSFM